MKYTSGRFQLTATDLSNHLSCRHLTQLSRSVALKEIDEPAYHDPAIDVLRQRGEKHEAAYVKFLQQKGLRTISLKQQPMDATVDAMRNGYDVIVQARLEDGGWLGYSDILLKVPGKSRFGNWAYEVQDTKLAQNTRASAILQLGLYSELVGRLQESIPARMYVVKPGEGFPTEMYTWSDFQAYYNLVKRNFEDVMAGPPVETYPESVEHCDICRWWQVCYKKRKQDDHLSLVAGLRSLHMGELKKQEIHTLEQYANADAIAKTERGNLEALLRKQLQAKVQLKARREGQMVFDVLPVEKGRGLNRLPEMNGGDIYFDIEGDAFYPDGGLEYLLGYAYRERNGTVVYKKIWATNRSEEKKSFEEFMAFVIARWRQHPGMYIYHFAPYEPTAIKRLARVHASFEIEVDNLLRAERFIDLHAVFKEALLAGVERYSLKELEKFTTYTRKVDLHLASISRKSVECALELDDFKSLPADTLRFVEDYNEDDCLATLSLHQWLESLRSDMSAKGSVFQRPQLSTGEANENVEQLDTRAQALFRSLTQSLPDNRETWNAEHRVKWLLAHLIEYFRREDKSAWWEFYRVHELEHEELLDERKAVAGLEFVKQTGQTRKGIPIHLYRFPPQEIGIDEGDEVIEVKGEKIGTVQAMSLENHTIEIKKTTKSADLHPRAVHVSERVDPTALANSLMNIALAIDEDGLDRRWSFIASKDLLMKRPPQLTGGRRMDEFSSRDPVSAAVDIALNLDKSVLAIQGPPGTGKTYTGAKMIIALLKAGKKVGVTAISHSVIRTLFQRVKELADEEGTRIEFVHKVTDKTDFADWIEEVTDSGKALKAVMAGKLVGGTAWLWADGDARGVLDYLFIDEAGQVSLSQVLASSAASHNLILLGDPQQLEQPRRGAHPEGSEVSALSYLLDGHATMPDGKGMLLKTTRRMHPRITTFTSRMFYEDKLTGLPGLENQVIRGGTLFDGAGLFYVPCAHSGNQNRSAEEIAAIESIVRELLTRGNWTDRDGVTRPLTSDDILVVAPFNAQVAGLIERLPQVRAGTVDKFQGKEAPVVIYSMVSSTTEDAPRGMSFLFSPNRLNVATSRALSVCILVASPRLLEPECKTIEQMRWANALCTFKEMAREVRIAMDQS